jgi:hypothetical protein
LPANAADSFGRWYFRITPSRGQGNGESLSTFPFKAGDCLLADRGYSTTYGIAQVVSQKADVIVRLKPQGIRLLNAQGNLFSWPQCLESIQRAGQISQWKAFIPLEKRSRVEGQICSFNPRLQGRRHALCPDRWFYPSPSGSDYNLEAYATLLFGASSDSSRSCGKTITAYPPRRRDGVK